MARNFVFISRSGALNSSESIYVDLPRNVPRNDRAIPSSNQSGTLQVESDTSNKSFSASIELHCIELLQHAGQIFSTANPPKKNDRKEKVDGDPRQFFIRYISTEDDAESHSIRWGRKKRQKKRTEKQNHNNKAHFFDPALDGVRSDRLRFGRP